MKVPEALKQKNDEHMKAHKKKLAMSQNKKLEKKRSYQIEEYNSTKNSTHLHYFDIRV